MMRTTKTLFTFLALFLGFNSFVHAQKSRGEMADTTKKVKNKEIVEESPAAEVFMVVEEMPEYPGENEAMNKIISSNLHYPKEALEENIQGRVIVQFVVDEQGKITDAKVLRGIGHGCDKEALRVINAMPNWKPGKQRGKPVRVSYTLPLIFKLG